MEYDDFIRKCSGIYSQFRDQTKIKTEGLRPNVPEKQGGYLITFRHPTEVADRVGELSEKVAKVVPSIVYDRSNVHTTISDFNVSDEFSPDPSILQKLADTSTDIIGCYYGCLEDGELEPMKINFTEWLFNQNTGIVAGIPNKSIFEITQEYIEIAKKYDDIMLRMPWGAHITACRFLETANPEQIDELNRIFKGQSPIGNSRPESIDVGHFTLSPEGFEYDIFESFYLDM